MSLRKGIDCIKIKHSYALTENVHTWRSFYFTPMEVWAGISSFRFSLHSDARDPERKRQKSIRFNQLK